MPAPIVRTARLLLRPFTPADAGDVFAYASNPNVSRHTTWQTHKSIAESEAFIAMVLRRGPDQHTWAICPADAPAVIGVIEFGPTGPSEADVHYVLAEAHWNRGLMTEAVRAVLAWGLETYPQVARVATMAVTANVGSLRVLGKCGFQFVGTRMCAWEKSAAPVEQSEYATTRNAFAAHLATIVA